MSPSGTKVSFIVLLLHSYFVLSYKLASPSRSEAKGLCMAGAGAGLGNVILRLGTLLFQQDHNSDIWISD